MVNLLREKKVVFCLCLFVLRTQRQAYLQGMGKGPKEEKETEDSIEEEKQLVGTSSKGQKKNGN